MGDIFLVTNPATNLWDRFLFALASWGTQSPLVHTGIYVGTAFGHSEPQVIEARPGGVGFKAAESYADAIWSTGRIDLTDEERQGIVSYVGSCVGMPYASRSLIATAFAQKRLGQLVSASKPLSQQPIWVRRLIRENAFICSALVVSSYVHVGKKILADYIPWLSSTGDLMRALGVSFENNYSGKRHRRGYNPWHWHS